MKASTKGLVIGLAMGAITLAGCGGDGDGDDPTSGNDELFTTAGFQKAYDAVKDKAGDNAQVLQLQITQGGADFKLRSGEQATGFVYTGGDLHDEEVDVIGPGSLEGQDYPFSEIDPAAIDKIVDGVESDSGAADTRVTVMTLERSAVDGTLRWSIVAEGGGRTGLPFNADPDGSNVKSAVSGITGSGTQ